MLALYGAMTLLGGVIVVRAIAPLAVSLIQQWSRSGVELRSQQIFNSIRPTLTELLPAGQTQAIAELFENVAQNERVIAVGFCDEAGRLQFPTKRMPPSFSCQQVARSETQSFSSMFISGRQMVVASFPVPAPGAKGQLVTLNGVSYSEERDARARSYLSLIVGGIILISATLATLAALIVVRWRLSKLRSTLSEATPARDFESDDASGNLPTAELLQTLRRLSPSRAEMDDEQSIWSAERLRALIRDELPGTDIIAVSNREPYIHNRTDDGIELQIPASGLVTALEPVMQACGGTWIAHGGGSADRETVDADDRLRVPPAKPSYTLRRVWLSDEEQDGYYYGLANEGLWPLCHIAFVQPTFRQEDWRTYRAVNQRFADAIAREARSKSPIVLIHDYHFALLPRMVLEQLPEATIITFWHIPWPNSETFGVCPWKEEVLKGMLGSSILGFHTRLHCNNFLYTVDRFMESRIDHDYASVTLGGHETLVRPYPISIEWPPAGLAEQKPVSECRAAVRSRLGLADNVRLAVGAERFDYTKGICERMRAVDTFLMQRPEWRGKLVFLQAAAPTRGKLGVYRALQDEAMRLAEEINARHAGYGPPPINLVVRYHEPHEVFELLRAADVCIVSSLHDGMNLVAKEFVAARDDERGVLILSRFAGASRELPEALIVNPYDSHGMSATILRALTMTEEEQQERMRAMRELVRSRNVYRWAGQMLLDASRLRNKQRIMRIAAQEKPKSDAMGETLRSPHMAKEFTDNWAMFLDFDGTLADIVGHPEAISIAASLVEHLTCLRDRLGGALAIISGRPIAALDRFLAPYEFDAAGVHGLERRLGGQPQHCPVRERGRLPAALTSLKERLPQNAGLLIEDKGCSVAVHWRMSPQLEGLVLDVIADVMHGLGPEYQLQQGKAVAEILSSDVNKGHAIEALLSAPPYLGRRPVFIGDDLTDEHGFDVVNGRGGVSVRVGPGPSRARFRLANPQAVRDRVRAWCAGQPINPEQDFQP